MKYEFLYENLKHRFDEKFYYCSKYGTNSYSQFNDIDIIKEENIETKKEKKLFGLIKKEKHEKINNYYIQFNYKNIIHDNINTVKILIQNENIDKAEELVKYIKKRISYENYKRNEPKNITVSVFYDKLDIKDYVVLDLETTGLDTEKEKITEFCLLKVKDGKVIDKICEIVNPEKYIPIIVEELTGITNEMVKDKHNLRKYMNSIIEFIGDNIIVGHNTIFDISFIKTALCTIKENEEIELKDISKIKYIDTLLLVELLEFPTKNYKLETLKEYLKIEQISHRAENDCYTTQKLYEICSELIIKESNVKEYLKSRKVDKKNEK